MNSSLVESVRRYAALLAILVGACATPPPVEDGAAHVPLRGIDFKGERASGPEAGTIEGFVTISNRRSTPVALAFPDPCVALLRVYEPDGDRLAPVWDQAQVSDCVGDPVGLDLAVGEERRVVLPAAPAAAILGDSLPPGRYRLAAYVRLESRIVEVELGEADLSAPR